MNELNINLGGYKGFSKFTQGVQKRWKIMDVEPRSEYVYDVNSLKPIQLKESVVDNYYASMIFEHIYPANIIFVLRELYRTLKPNGKIRIVVPDIKKGLSAYFNNEYKWLASSHCPTPESYYPPTCLGKLLGWFYTDIRDVKGALRHGHNMVFDFETLNHYLEKTYFRKIQQRTFNDCSDVFFGKDFKRYEDWALYVEAIK